jgi:HlyD family secretion protein
MKIPAFVANHKLATFICVLLIVGVPTGYALKARGSDIKYQTAPVTRGNITAVVQATGVINPLTTVPVGSFVSGTVQYVFADYNTSVKANQVLALLDPSYYEAQYTTAVGNLDNAVANEKNLEANVDSMKATIVSDQANVAKLDADAVYARVNGKRVQDLATQGIDTKDQVDLAVSTTAQANAAVDAGKALVAQARAQLAQAQAQVDSAKAQIISMKGALDEAETNLRYCVILSPIDGTVVARNVTVGQSVAASLQAPNVFTIAQDLTRMQVYSKTDESDTGSIKIGTEVTFQVDAFPNEVFHGRVSAIHLNAYTVQNVVTYDTVVDFENPDEKLLPGETAYVTIPTGHSENALRIPNAALSFTPDMAYSDLSKLYQQNNIRKEAYTTHIGGWQVVWKLVGEDNDKKLQPVAVQVGITDYSNTQLLQGSLQENDPLVTLQTGGNKNAANQNRNPLTPSNQRGPGGRGR